MTKEYYFIKKWIENELDNSTLEKLASFYDDKNIENTINCLINMGFMISQKSAGFESFEDIGVIGGCWVDTNVLIYSLTIKGKSYYKSQSIIENSSRD